MRKEIPSAEAPWLLHPIAKWRGCSLESTFREARSDPQMRLRDLAAARDFPSLY